MSWRHARVRAGAPSCGASADGKAGYAMIRRVRGHDGSFTATAVADKRTARMETAARRRLRQVGRSAGEAGPRGIIADARLARDQVPGVGVLRRCKQLGRPR